MAFVYKDNMDPNGTRILFPITMADSLTFTVGEAVKYDGSGNLVAWAAGGSGLGILVAFRKADKSPVTDDGSGGVGGQTYLTGASNTVEAFVDVSKYSRYTVPADATLGTNGGSDVAGSNLDLTAGSLTLSESSVQAVGTTASFHSWGVDPDGSAPSNSLIVSIQESQVWI